MAKRSTPKETGKPWQSRITGEGYEAPDQLLANPKNWRVHPTQQQEGLEAVLDKVGWVQRVVVNKRTGHLVDGHLRVTLAMRRNEAKIPVLYVDLTEEEEDLVLATIDPLAGLATTDNAQLQALLGGLGETGDENLDALLDSIGATGHELLRELGGEGERKDQKDFNPVISYNLIFDNVLQQDRWFEFIRALKTAYEGDTISAKLDAFLEATSETWGG